VTPLDPQDADARPSPAGVRGRGTLPTVRVQEAPFDLAAEAAALTGGRADVGGLASFVGVCRVDDGLAALVLEHYPGMTERAIARIAEEACARWPLTGCTVVHRVGRLPPGSPIVLVLTASSHRAAALVSCAFLIDWLKTRAPFWKREEFADGREARWVEARAEDEEAATRWDAATAAGRSGAA
jgi:molybdopterin synthase catalytic subunit